MGAVVGAQLGEDIPDAPLDGLFGYGQLIGDLLVRVPGGNQPQDVNFRFGQGVVGGVFGPGRRRCMSSAR